MFNRVDSLWMGLDRYLGAEGFNLETSRHGYFSIETLALGEDSSRFLKFFLATVGDWAANHMQRPAAVFIDEFGVWGEQAIKKFLMQGRSFGLAIFLSTQSMSSLGTPAQQTEFLDLCNNIFLMNSNTGGSIATLAGVKETIEAMPRIREGAATSDGTIRLAEEYKIKQSDISDLRPGEGYFLRRGQSWKLKIKDPGRVTIDPRAVALFPKATETVKKREPVARMEGAE